MATGTGRGQGQALEAANGAHEHDGVDAALLLRRLADAGGKLTAPRRILAEEIARRDRHFTAADILAAVEQRHPEIGRATVFRTLDRFVKLGAIARVHLDSGSHAYALCDHPADEHHHHLICSKCGVVVDLPECPLDTSLERIGREQGFQVVGHRLEVFGQCPACRE